MSYANPQGLSLDDILGNSADNNANNNDSNPVPATNRDNNDSPTAALRHNNSNSGNSPSFSPNQNRPKTILTAENDQQHQNDSSGLVNSNTSTHRQSPTHPHQMNPDNFNQQQQQQQTPTPAATNPISTSGSSPRSHPHQQQQQQQQQSSPTNKTPGSPSRNPLDQEAQNKNNNNSSSDWMNSDSNNNNENSLPAGQDPASQQQQLNNASGSSSFKKNQTADNNTGQNVGATNPGDISGTIPPPPDSAAVTAAVRELNEHQRHPAILFGFVSLLCFTLSIASTATNAYSYDRGEATVATNRATFDLTLWTAKFCIYGISSTSCADDTLPFSNWCTALGDRWRAMQAFSILVVLYSAVILVLGVAAVFPNFEVVKKYVWTFVVMKVQSPTRFILYVCLGFWFLLLILWALMAGSFNVAPCSDTVAADQRNRIYGVRTLLESGFKLSSGFALALVMWFYLSGTMIWMFYKDYIWRNSRAYNNNDSDHQAEEELRNSIVQNQHELHGGRNSHAIKEDIPDL